jgi:HK97 gp10 family phage protein
MIEAKLVDVQVRALQRMLENVPKKLRNKILRQELRKGAKALVPPSKAATPARTGKLRRAVKVRAQKRSQKSVGVFVGYSEKGFTGDTFYGSFLEWGWRGGKRKSGVEVLGGRKKRRFTQEQRDTVQSANDSRVKQPGRFFLTRVATTRGPAVLNAVIKSVSQRIETEAKSA